MIVALCNDTCMTNTPRFTQQEKIDRLDESNTARLMAEDRAEAAEAERDALLPIKESWSQLKRELDEVRAKRNALAVDLRQCRTRPVVTQLVAAEAERDRCWNALRKIADSGCSLALGGGKPTCRESMPDPRDSWDWCTRCVAAHALAALTEPEEK
jgi:hypothetical protein